MITQDADCCYFFLTVCFHYVLRLCVTLKIKDVFFRRKVFFSRGKRCFIFVYRFSAFWLRSKCSICSFQFNRQNVVHWITLWLNVFLNLDKEIHACMAFVTRRPRIAVLRGTAHTIQLINYFSLLGCNSFHWLEVAIHSIGERLQFIPLVRGCNSFHWCEVAIHCIANFFLTND